MAKLINLDVKNTTELHKGATVHDHIVLYDDAVQENKEIFADSGQFAVKSSDEEIWILLASKTSILYRNNKIWHAGDMGPDSGLNADMLDGYHASSFKLKDDTDDGHNDSRYLKITGGDMTGGITWSDSSTITSSSPMELGFKIIDGLASGYVASYAHMLIQSNSDNGAGDEYIKLTAGGIPSYTDGRGLTVHSDRVLFDGNAVWHSANDGAGSGLDADMLDGQHGSFYLSHMGGTLNGGPLNIGTNGMLVTSGATKSYTNIPNLIVGGDSANNGSFIINLGNISVNMITVKYRMFDYYSSGGASAEVTFTGYTFNGDGWYSGNATVVSSHETFKPSSITIRAIKTTDGNYSLIVTPMTRNWDYPYIEVTNIVPWRANIDMSKVTCEYITADPANISGDKLITVEGSYSKDSELLEGHAASYFSPSTHTHDDRYLELTGGALSGSLDIRSIGGLLSLHGGAGGSYIQYYTDHTDTRKAYVGFGNTGDINFSIINECGGNIVLGGEKATFNGYDIITSADEGHNNGFNADMLDGKHASAFSLVDHNHDGVYSKLDHNHDTRNDGRYLLLNGSNTMDGIINWDGSGEEVKTVGSPFQVGFSNIGAGTGYMGSYSSVLILADSDKSSGITEYVKIGAGIDPTLNQEEGFIVRKDALKFNGEWVWSGITQGSGTGMDSDMLDGKHASAFSLTGHLHDDRYIIRTGDNMSGYLGFHFDGIGTNPGNGQLRLGAGSISGVNMLAMYGAGAAGLLFPKDGVSQYNETVSNYYSLRVDGYGNLQLEGENISTDKKNSVKMPFVSSGTSNLDDLFYVSGGGNGAILRDDTNGHSIVRCNGDVTLRSKFFIPATDIKRAIAALDIKCRSGSGNGTIYVGLVSYDKNFSEISTDSAQTWNYIVAGYKLTSDLPILNVREMIGEYNSTSGSDGSKIDPYAAYYNIIMLLNYQSDGAARDYEIWNFETGLLPMMVYDKLKHIGINEGATSGTDNVNIDGIIRANKVYNAVWNDYAEYFEKGEDIEPGDVVELDLESNGEIYVKTTKAYSNAVVGVCSDEFGQCLGGKGDGYDDINYSPIGLAGRVRVKLTGKARKGDLLTSSSIPGVAMVANNDTPNRGCIIGKCLENKCTEDIERVRMLIQLT